MDIVKWGDIAFYVKPSAVRGVRDINISVGTETEDSTEGDEKYVKRKSGNGYQVTMRAILNAYLGEKVQETALKLTEAARCGQTGYLYCGTSKLFPCNFMMTNAAISNVQMGTDGTWIHCEVALTLQQCSKFGGDTGASKVQKTTATVGAATQKASVKNTGTKTTQSFNPLEYLRAGLKRGAGIINQAKAALGVVDDLVAAAKKATNNVKKTNTTTNGATKLSGVTLKAANALNSAKAAVSGSSSLLKLKPMATKR